MRSLCVFLFVLVAPLVISSAQTDTTRQRPKPTTDTTRRSTGNGKGGGQKPTLQPIGYEHRGVPASRASGGVRGIEGLERSTRVRVLAPVNEAAGTDRTQPTIYWAWFSEDASADARPATLSIVGPSMSREIDLPAARSGTPQPIDLAALGVTLARGGEYHLVLRVDFGMFDVSEDGVWMSVSAQPATATATRRGIDAVRDLARRGYWYDALDLLQRIAQGNTAERSDAKQLRDELLKTVAGIEPAKWRM